MKQFLTSTVTVCLLAATTAQGASLRLGIGIRETDSTAEIGANGGTVGPIEWVNRGAYVIEDNGLWQTISINLATASVTGFTGNGTLESSTGRAVLEHIAIDIVDSAGPFKLYLDNLTYTDASGNATLITGWEGLSEGAEFLFQEPTNSGSTSGLLDENYLHTSRVVVGGAGNGSDAAYEINFLFKDETPTNWLRLTTIGFNPTIGLDGVVSFDVRLGDSPVVPEPATWALTALASGWLLRRRR